MFFIAQGLREFESLFMVTVFEGSMIVSGCFCGVLVLREFDDAEWWRIIGFGVCVVVVVLGIWLLFVGQMEVLFVGQFCR